jgi:hypothetical protein
MAPNEQIAPIDIVASKGVRARDQNLQYTTEKIAQAASVIHPGEKCNPQSPES